MNCWATHPLSALIGFALGALVLWLRERRDYRVDVTFRMEEDRADEDH